MTEKYQSFFLFQEDLNKIELQWSCCRFLLIIQEKSATKMKNAKGCFGSEIVAGSIRSHMTQLYTFFRTKNTWKINSYFSIITQILNTSKQSLQFTVTSQNSFE